MAKVAGMRECVEALAMQEGISKVEAQNRMESVLKVITDKCIEGGVAFRDMFTIKKVLKKGRSGSVNGVAYNTPDKNSLKITVGSALDHALNE